MYSKINKEVEATIKALKAMEIEKFVSSSVMNQLVEILRNNGLFNTMNGKKPISEDEAQRLIRLEIRKLLIMINMSSWHSSKDGDVYHTSYHCRHSNDIEPENIMPGRGGKDPCSRCPS